MKRAKLTYAAGALIVAALVAAGGAPDATAQIADSSLVARYQLAESYLRSAQFDRAITLLEDLVARTPGTFVFYDKLREAYESVKRYDDAIALVDARLEIESAAGPLLSEKARLLYLKNDEEGAFAAWEAAIQAAPDRPGSYLVVYRSQLQMRLFERAIDVLERGRAALANPLLFQVDLAYLYGLESRHADAMREYLALLGQNEGQITFVRGRLAQQIEQEEALTQSIEATEEAVRQTPLSRAYRELLAWLYLEAGRFDDALDANRAIDRLEQEQGLVLINFAQLASGAAAYGPALEAYAEVLDRYPDAPSAPEARRSIGSLYEQWASRTAAVGDPGADSLYIMATSAYTEFLNQHPGHELFPDVLLAIANIQLDVRFDLPAADSTLTTIVSTWPGTVASDEAEFDLARLALMQDRAEQARTRFARLADRLRTGELAEAARYEQALLQFYSGSFDAAQALTESMDDNTSADVANDVITLKVLMMENTGPDSLSTPLRMYARAQLRAHQRRPVAALAIIDSLLATLPDHPLADEAHYARSGFLAETGRSAEAVASYLEFPLIFPDSHLADRSLYDAASIQSAVLGDEEAAATSLTRLITEFPGSLLVAEARSRLRRLRGDGL